ncbi:MAG: 50S ribosome-binding GTPase [Ardenticatenaceae bacterium]|nr:50S ribosome-binding GTPase [Ardenticatenaceae bacterium]MCB9444882.1 50S ribosome-binding GTPase [Ardenticatenaceae bacterium]
MMRLRVALAGNPNTGKSTIFNALTGSNQHVGNWPGKTVAKKEGCYHDRGLCVELIDLPGTYSLSAYSPDEEVARDYIVLEKPDVVVNVLDVTNLERNLYLTMQILETAVPLIVVLNMHDVAERNGTAVNQQKLSQLLGGIPIICAAAGRGEGLDELRQALWQFTQRRESQFVDLYKAGERCLGERVHFVDHCDHL